jgi:hypothetical protein
MSDANLMAFGGAVSFIALAGAYAYLRECFTAGEQAPDRSSDTWEHESRGEA